MGKKQKSQIDFIKSMKILKFKPGDVVVLKSDASLGDHRDKILELIKKILPEGVKCLLLESGMDIGVLRNEK